MNKRFISLITATTVTASLFMQPAVSPIAAADTPTQMEYLDRGTVAVKSGSGVYLSWRLLGTENYDTAFDVYRGTTKIAAALDATNYTDSTAGTSYTIVPSGQARSSGKAVTVNANQYITIPLDRPASGISLDDGSEYTYSPNDVTPADVDGDGEYELILKWEPSNSFDSGKPANHNGNVYIDCYKMNGTKLWRIDMGININAGAHFTQIAAYDFDLDGRAELAMKTAPGTVDGMNKYVSEASSISEIRSTDNSADYRHSEYGIDDTSGRVMSGPEFYTVFQGDTGTALDTVYYPHPRGTVTEWGDNWGNRSERYLTAVAYLDGQNPSMLAWRGYYAKTTVTAYNLVNKKLVQVADFDTSKGGNSRYSGNGNHNITVGDVDGDGCDEVITGSLALDNDLSVLWCSGRGHGDALHLADYDPTHDGMEYFSVHEDYGGSQITGSTTGNDGKQHLGGMTLYKAENGEELFHIDSYSDLARGMMANVGYSKGYFEFWGAGNYSSYGGECVLSAKYNPDSSNQRVFWNGDLYDELFDGTGARNEGSSAKISGKDGRIQTFNNVITNNGTKNNASLIADLFGDWREEIVMRGSDNESLLVYTTVIPTNHKLYTLMHDRTYRMQVACQNAAYNQPPHIGYYVNDENDEYDTRKYAAYVKTVHDGEEAVRTKNLPDEKPDIRPTPLPTPTPEPTPTPTAVPTPTPTIDPNAEFVVENGVLTYYQGDGGAVVIPESYGGQRITAIAESAFSLKSSITSIIMPDSITQIDPGAFQNCSRLTNIVLSEKLTEVSDIAFSGCESLSEINLPKSVKIIMPFAFSRCTALTKINLDDITEIQLWAFDGCTSLTEITLGENTKIVEREAFRGCDNLEKLVVTSSNTELNALFNGYTNNGKITIYGPSGSKAEEYAYAYNIPFVSTTPPTPTPEPTPAPTPKPEFEVNENGTLIAYNGSDADVVIPEEINGIKVTAIGNNAFDGNTEMISVTIPDSVTSIGTSAFSYCTSLRKVDTNKVETIGATAFYGCTNLEEIIFGENVNSLGMRLCVECKNLKKLVVLNRELSLNGTYMWPDGIIKEIHGYIGSQAESYAHINNIPFYDIETGKRIIKEWVIDDIGTIVAYNGEEKDIIIPETVDGIPVDTVGNIFEGSDIVSISIPDCVTHLSSYAFSNCTELKEVKLSNGMTKILNRVFENCTSLEKVVIPPNITSINESAFDGCDKSKLVIYGASGSEAEKYAKEHDIKFIADQTLPTVPPATPTPEPTATPTAKPTDAPTPEPTATPTTKPTAEPTQSPTPEPTKTPEPYNYPYRVTAHSTNMLPGYVSITAKCYEKKENAVMIFAVYNEDGILSRVNTKILSSNGRNIIMQAFPYTDGRFKVFIWNMNTQEPYSEVYIGVNE